MKVGIIGCGLMGSRRAKHLLPDDELVACYDPAEEWPHATDAMRLVRVSTVQEVLLRSEVVVVATTHDALALNAKWVVQAGHPCLLEKPCARNLAEFKELSHAIDLWGKAVIPGFTVRHFPGIREARRVIEQGDYGEPLYMRATYGHGGRQGYGEEWRCDPDKSGGGELLDQGVHLIDLAYFLLGSQVYLRSSSFSPRVWSPKVEDSVFLTLNTSTGQVAQLHASWTEWRPTFRVEVICQNGGIHIEGLGGAYGEHQATFFTRYGVERRCSWGDARDEALKEEWTAFRKVCQKAPDLERTEQMQSVIRVVTSVYRGA